MKSLGTYLLWTVGWTVGWTVCFLFLSRPPGRSSTVAAANGGSDITPAFKKAAWKALDAIERVNPVISRDSVTQIEQLKILDAQKTTDDAKYEASSDLDKHYSEVEEIAIGELDSMSMFVLASPEWKQHANRKTQCVLEAAALLTPNDIPPEGKTRAKDATCTVDSAWEEKK